MSKPTPGEWRIGQNQYPFSENYLHTAIGVEGREEAIVVFPIMDDETEANARLIVGAKDLLAMCKVALEFAKTMREEPIDSEPLEKHICELETAIAEREATP